MRAIEKKRGKIVSERKISRRELFGSISAFASVTFLGSMLSGCLDFEYSPYCTKTDHENLNANNLSEILRISASKTSSSDFKIGLISDTHHFYSETEKAVSLLNNISDLDFVIIIGDTTNAGLIKEYNWGYDVINELRYPYVHIIGNHDCLDNGIDIFKGMYGPLNFTFSFLDTEFICFNNNNWESTEPDYDWLETSAAASVAKRRVLLSHIDNSDSAFERYSTVQINRFNAIVSQYFDCAIHGHAHEESKEKLVDGVPRYQIGSPGYGHYMVATFTCDGIGVERCVF